MSLGADYYNDTAYDHEFGIRYTENLDELTELTDDELIAKAISTGPGLDKYEHFPAYTVAMKMRTYGWRISSKQREAMRNCLAYYLSERDM